ncbi:MAG: hypothetical protein DDT31_01796 [Syntrophomonadaceae bacterium]|nr:hypothetical protein [Bacillota bacterium]
MPALESDIEDLYFWHGVFIPSEWITDKSSLDAKTAVTWPNIEQRRAACELVGWNAILNELSAKTIDHDVNPEHGTLYEVDLPDSPKEKFLRVKCATGRVFALRIDPDAKTVLEAQCWVKYRHFDTSKFKYPSITA